MWLIEIVSNQANGGATQFVKQSAAAICSSPASPASPTAIELHLVADGDESEARDFIAARERELVDLFGREVFGFDDDPLESILGKLLTARGATVSTAESCTGGLLASRITDVGGSSAYFMGGAVCYTAAAKSDLAYVDPQLIREHGEVSEPVAIALARGARQRFGTIYGVGITGIAGPGGGRRAKPVGTVAHRRGGGRHAGTSQALLAGRAKHHRIVFGAGRTGSSAHLSTAAIGRHRLMRSRQSNYRKDQNG